MNSASIDITPDVSLLRKSGEVNYKIPDAVAELVDNPLDEREPGRRLTIEVTVGQRKGEKFLEVQDNARGMTRTGLGDAMVMARSSKAKGKIGEFGMGMKTACSNLGRRFEIVTCVSEESAATRLFYDEDLFIAANKWEIDVEEVEKPFDHGTRITITQPKTNFYPGVKDTMLRKFGKLFKHYVASGEVEIIINGELVEPYVPDTIPEYDTEIVFDVNGKVVRGWASLARTGSNKGAYGFDLIRQNRVIKEHEKIGFKAAAGLSRLVGELHLNDFPVTNNKTDFRVDTEEWELLSGQLEERLTDLKRENRRLANPGKSLQPKDDAEVKEYIEVVTESLKATELQQDLDRRALDADLGDAFAEGPLPFDLPSSKDDDGARGDSTNSKTRGTATEGREVSKVTEQRLQRVKTQLRNITIEHQIMRLGKDTVYKIWEVEGVGNHKKLVVTSNVDHPFYGVIGDAFMIWIKHNIVEAVAEFFTEATGKTEAMLLIKSDILKHIGKMKIDLVELDGDGTSE